MPNVAYWVVMGVLAQARPTMCGCWLCASEGRRADCGPLSSCCLLSSPASPQHAKRLERERVGFAARTATFERTETLLTTKVRLTGSMYGQVQG